jgi:3-oxoacid CoA-transferase A subunit
VTRRREGVIDKVIGSPADAVSDIESGSVIGIGGFGVIHGFPVHLITAVRDRRLADLVVVCNSLGAQPTHPVTLVAHGQARKLVAAFSARAGDAVSSARVISPVPLEVELVPQGILVERLRCAGAGLGPFYSPVGQDTILAYGKERREFDGQAYVLEEPLRLDYALIYARTADRAGNLAFRGASQNFGPSFAKAAKVVIAQVDDIVDVGELTPDEVGLPGIFVDRVVQSEPVWLRKGACAFDTVAAFEMARGGRLDAVVLGAHQVGADGSFANWTTPQMGGVLRECAPGFGPDDVRQLTGAPLVVELWAQMSDTSRSDHVAWQAELGPGRRAA